MKPIKQYKASIWQAASEKWCVNCTDDLGGKSVLWWIPCRILDISPIDFVLLLKDKYNATHFSYSTEYDVLLYDWDNYADAHRWQLFLNKEARNKKIIL